jgi:hypothetical protein
VSEEALVRLQKKGGDAPPADLEAASLEELHQKILTLEKEKNKEEEYRNYMQLERVRSGYLSRGLPPGMECSASMVSACIGQDQCFLGNHKEGSRGS